jgi:hypothetical protein
MTVANDLKSVLQHEVDELVGLRQEIQLKVHLAKAEARTEFDRLEKTWQRLQEELGRIHPTGDQKGIEANARTLLEQLKTGYEAVKRQSAARS